jgi:hypothetical protein
MCEETVIDMDSERDLKGAVRDLAEAMEKGQTAHPSHDELLGYAAGALDAAEQDRIEDHLALCRECARTVLALTVLADGGLEEDRPPVRVLAAAALPYALAASLLLAVGLGWRTVRLGEEVRQLSAPRSDVYVADLVPTGSAGPRERGEPEAVHPPAWASRVVLILAFGGPASHPEYAVELATADGRPLWSRRGLQPGPDGTFVLDVPRPWLSPGTYRIRLSGLRGAAAQEVARYELRIEPEVP